MSVYHLLRPPRPWIRSRENLTSAAFISRPLWNSTPLRSWNTYVFGSGWVQDWARSGTGWKSRSSAVRAENIDSQGQ